MLYFLFVLGARLAYSHRRYLCCAKDNKLTCFDDLIDPTSFPDGLTSCKDPHGGFYVAPLLRSLYNILIGWLIAGDCGTFSIIDQCTERVVGFFLARQIGGHVVILSYRCHNAHTAIYIHRCRVISFTGFQLYSYSSGSWGFSVHCYHYSFRRYCHYSLYILRETTTMHDSVLRF